MRLVARILKSNGTDGEVLISFLGMDPEEINPKEPVFVEFDGLPVPFFFESITRRGNNRVLARLTGVRNLTDADELAGRDLYLEAPEEAEEEDVIGWTVLDSDGTIVGTVRDYEDIPGNLCIWVARPDGREVLLPLHDDLVIELSEESRTLMLEIPEGLL